MTSKKSSADAMRFTFLYSIKKGWFIPALYAAFLLMIMAAFGVGSAVADMADIRKGAADTSLTDYIAQTKYIIFEDNSIVLYVFAHVAGLAAAIGLAVLLFKFVTSKKTVNVYFSLGIRRTELFTARYLAGAVMLFASAVIPFAVNIAVNGAIFGFSADLFKNSAYFALGLGASMLAVFGVTVFVLCLVGSIVEGLIYSGILIMSPIIVNTVITALFGIFVKGSAYNEYISVTPDAISRFGVSFGFSPLPFIEKYNPFLLNLDEDSSLLMSLEKFAESVPEPDFKPIIFGFAAAFVIAAAALFAFKRKKAEHAGFLGVNKVLTSVCCFLVSSEFTFGAASMLCEKDSSSGRIITAAACCAVIVLVYIIAQSLLSRSIKAIGKNKISLFAQLGTAVILCAVFAGGLFGFSSRIPAAEKIDCAYITTGIPEPALSPYTNSPSGLWNTYMESEETGADYAARLISVEQSTSAVTGEFRDAKSVERIRKIHSELIKGGKGASKPEIPVSIVYILKNGKKTARTFYSVPDGIFAELDELRYCEEYNSLLAASLRFRGDVITDSESVMLFSPDLGTVNVSNQLSRKGKELYEALAKDAEAGNSPIVGRKNMTPLGYIVLGEGEVSVINAVTDEVLFNYSSALGDCFSLISYCTVSYPVYPDMSNTLALLKGEGLENGFEAKEKAAKIRLFDAADVSDKYPASVSMSISGFVTEAKSEYSMAFTGIADEDAARVITSPAEIEAALKSIRFTGAYDKSGELAEIVYENGTRVLGYMD